MKSPDLSPSESLFDSFLDIPGAPARPIRSLSLEKLAEFLSIQSSVRNSYHLKEALQAGCRATVQLLGCATAVIALKSDDGVQIVEGWSEEGRLAISSPWRVSPSHSIAYQAIERGELVEWERHPYRANTNERDDAIARKLQVEAAGHRAVAWPFIGSGRAFGALVANTGKHEETSDENVLLGSLIASTIALSIEENQAWIKSLDKKELVVHETVAQQIHDTLAQDICALGFVLQELAKQEQADYLVKRLAKAQDLCGRIQESARALIYQRPQSTKEQKDLTDIILDEMEQSGLGNGAGVLRIADVKLEALPFEIREAFLLIIRESFKNMRKHSNPTSCFVFVGQHGSEVRLTIQNDGIPMPCAQQVAPLTEGLHFGLKNLELMVKKLGGVFSAYRDEEEGTFTVRSILKP